MGPFAHPLCRMEMASGMPSRMSAARVFLCRGMTQQRAIPCRDTEEGRMPLAAFAALGRAVPVQNPGGLVVPGLEQIGVDRLRQRGIVDEK